MKYALMLSDVLVKYTHYIIQKVIIMRLIAIMAFFSSLLFSKIYYAKVEPYEIREISSNVSGLVLSINEDMIGKRLTSKPYIEIDSELDVEELNNVKEKIIYLKNIITTNEKVLINLEGLLLKKRENYKKVKELKIKSSIEKDREYYDLITSENIYLSTLKDMSNLKISVSDLKLRRAQLQRSLKDKNLRAEGFTLYSISVRAGQVVGISAPLAKIADISKAKLTIYLDDSDLIGIENKKVYLDGALSKYKISRILNIADAKNISKYMAQIIIDSPAVFSKLVKVELK